MVLNESYNKMLSAFNYVCSAYISHKLSQCINTLALFGQPIESSIFGLLTQEYLTTSRLVTLVGLKEDGVRVNCFIQKPWPCMWESAHEMHLKHISVLTGHNRYELSSIFKDFLYHVFFHETKSELPLIEMFFSPNNLMLSVLVLLNT